MTDLFGHKMTFIGLPMREQAARLYEEADMLPAGSPERIQGFKDAAEAQRKADEADFRRAEERKAAKQEARWEAARRIQQRKMQRSSA